jgi:hypothetical protein
MGATYAAMIAVVGALSGSITTHVLQHRHGGVGGGRSSFGRSRAVVGDCRRLGVLAVEPRQTMHI